MKNSGTDDGEAQVYRVNLNENLPKEIGAIIAQRLGSGDIHPELAVSTDITLDGLYRQNWLIVAAGKILVVDSAAEEPIRKELDTQRVKSVIVRHLYGNGVIEVTYDGKVFDLFRFSKSYADKMNKVGPALSNLCQGSEDDRPHVEVLEESGEEANTNKCMSCGKSIPRDIRVCPDCLEKRQTFKRVLGYVKPYRGLALVCLFLAILGTVLTLAPQMLTKILVDEVIMKQQADLLLWLILTLVGAFGLNAFVQGSRGYLTAKLGQSVLFDLRTHLYEHLQRLSVNFYDKRQTGAIMSRVIGDVNRMQAFLSQGLQDVLTQLFIVVVICVLLFLTNARLAFLALIPIPFVFVATAWFGKRIRKVWHRVQRRSAELNAILGDTLPGIRVVKAFGREQNEVQRFTEKHKEFHDVMLLAALMSNRFHPAIGFMVAFGIMIIWGFGGRLVIEGMQNPEAAVITLGDLILFTNFLWQLYGPIQRLSQLSTMLQQAATSAERIFAILDNQPEKPDAENPLVVDSIKGEVFFKNVSFEYEKGEKVLDNINIHIRPGEMVGLVGASGSGKTTLINLLSRFYHVDQGQILIDGIDINDIEIRSLRDQMAVVLQEPFLFHATIAENIAYGKPNATKEEIIWAAQMANAHEFISRFPDSYDTILGERGTGLSGGQKQRLSIARAILRDPRILILDEATSSVDTVTESLIQDAIDRLVRNRTTIAIAHRLSTLKNADRIIVMDEGKIVEQGTHEELLANNGPFAKLVKMQSKIARDHITDMDKKSAVDDKNEERVQEVV